MTIRDRGDVIRKYSNMHQGLAYHTGVEAMRDYRRFEPALRFSMAIKSCLDGHRKYDDLRAAAANRRAQGWSDETVTKAVFEWIQTDLNPAVQLGRMMAEPTRIVAGFNFYNEAVNLGVRTNVDGDGLKRLLVCADRDDELCKASTRAILQALLGDATAHGRHSVLDIRSGWRAALYLGAERLASAEAMKLLEEHGDKDLMTLALSLGSSSRTLQRQVAAEGLTITELRMAARQQRAFRLLQSRMGLCQVAHEAGYADQAHMARSFKISCGLTPRQLVQILVS